MSDAPGMTAEQMSEIVDNYRAKLTACAMEVSRELYHRLPFGTAFTLADGRVGTVAKFYEPKIDEEGEIRFGVDVNLDDGSHIGFTIRQTDWGGFAL